MKLKETDMERFYNKIDQRFDCWNWTACKTHFGYGHFKLGNRMVMAHRISWEITNGTIPKGLYVLHKCDNPSCVNPNHLFLGTYRDNAQDRQRKGRSKSALMDRFKAQITCSKGHLYDHKDYLGRRICRLCKRDSLKKWRHRKGISKNYYAQA